MGLHLRTFQLREPIEDHFFATERQKDRPATGARSIQGDVDFTQNALGFPGTSRPVAARVHSANSGVHCVWSFCRERW